MGGVSSGFKKVLGMPRADGKPGTVAEQIREPAQPTSKTASQVDAEDRSARRRARRGARALLSESRLNPEQGVTTLGQSGML
jgi:hypothetical protein